MPEVFDHLPGIDSVTLNVIGGLDSRTVLVGLLDRGVTPQLLYGVDNNPLVCTGSSDREIVRQLAEAFDLSFSQMDWSGDHPHDSETLEKSFERYGFLFTLHGEVDSYPDALDGGITLFPTLQLGGYSSVFSNSKIWEQPDEEYSFDDLMDHYVDDFVGNRAFDCERTYRDHVGAHIESALQQSPLDYDRSGKSLSTFVQAQFLLDIRSSATIANLMNEFSHYVSPFGLKCLHNPLLTVPMEYRRNDEF
ncbi:hypothetical protein [Haladaptatus sp. NG-SE-30]